MNKQEYKDWYRDIRLQAREIAEDKFEKHPHCQIVRVPYWPPIYISTPENEELKIRKEFANAGAWLRGSSIPFPELDIANYVVEVKRR